MRYCDVIYIYYPFMFWPLFVVPCSPGWPWAYYVAKDNSELLLCLHLLSTDWFTGVCRYTRFIQYWKSNPGLCAYKESILPAEPLQVPCSLVLMSVFSWSVGSIVSRNNIMVARHGRKSCSAHLMSTRQQKYIRGRGCGQDISFKSRPLVTRFC